jgi:uncharacterized protein DUF3892
MVYVEAIHLVGGERHEHIAAVRWRNPATNQTGTTERSGMVDWIRKGGDARVTDGNRTIQIGVVNANPPYIRTHADGVWTDNLLALRRY